MKSTNESTLFAAIARHEEHFDSCVNAAVKESFATNVAKLSDLDWSTNLDKEEQSKVA